MIQVIITKRYCPTLIAITFFLFSCHNSSKKNVDLSEAITQEQKSQINLIVDEVRISRDSISQAKALEKLPSLLNNDSTREYAITAIKNKLKYPESNVSVVSRPSHIESSKPKTISKFTKSTKSRPTVNLKIPKWNNVQPLERLKLILEYYYKDSTSEAEFNKYWKISEIQNLLKKIEPYNKYYVSAVQFLQENIHKRKDTIQKLPVTGYLLSYELKLSKYIYLGKKLNEPIKQSDTFSVENLSKGNFFYSSLSENDKFTNLTPSTKERIRNGDLIIPSEIYERYKKQLLPLTSVQTNQLIAKYNTNLNDFLQVLKISYIPSLNTGNISLQLKDIVAFEKSDSGIFTKRFSYEFIYSYLFQYLNTKTSNSYLSVSVIKDVFKQLTIANYAELIRVKEHPKFQKSPINILFNRDSTEIYSEFQSRNANSKTSSLFKTIGRLYNQGYVKEVVVKQRKFYITNKKVMEKGFVKLNNGRQIPYSYQTQIPFNLVNRVMYNQQIFHTIYYSFFERDLRLEYSQNAPCFEFIDILQNSPIECLAYLNNGINNKNEPISLTINAIRLNVSAGHPQKLFKEIGLKVGYQRDLDTSIFISRILQEIKSTNDITSFSDSLFNVTPQQLRIATSNNLILDSLDKFETFQAFLKNLYAVSFEKQANLIMFNIQKDRAIRLPEKAKCNGCYDVFWCDQKRNDALNRARSNTIGTSQNAINNYSNMLRRLSNVDILSSKDKNELTPLSSVYDSRDSSFVNYFQITKNGAGCVYAVKFDSASKKNIKQILKLSQYVNQIDPYFFQRYSVDLSNLSTHGYRFLANLFSLFQAENSSKNSLAHRLLQEGYINTDFNSMNFDITRTNAETPFVEQLYTEHFMFLDERNMVSQINTKPVLDSIGLTMLSEQVNSINQNMVTALQPDINRINANFDEADKEWNSWFIFIGYSTNGNSSVPIIIFSGGSIRVNIALRSFGALPIFPIPNFKST
jgi:hypothetical protein